MIKFIIYEDNISVQEKVISVINKIMLPSNLEYRVDKFVKYDVNLKNVIENEDGPKIYILDIEVPNKSGLDLARQIRENDWNSSIIISTIHEDLTARAFRSRLMILDLVSKFDNYEETLKQDIEIALEILDCKKKLMFEYNKIQHILDLSDITYITPLERKTVIYTKNKEYLSNLCFSEVVEQLDDRFVQTHRSCIVNIRQIKSIDYKENIITFNDGTKIDLLTQTYKRILKENVTI